MDLYLRQGGRTHELINVLVKDCTEILRILRRPHGGEAVRIELELPQITRKGVIMPNFELADDAVATITIKTTNLGGTTVSAPAGDVFSAVSSNPTSLGAAIGTDKSGAPALVLTPLVQASPNIAVTVADSSGLTQAIQLVDIVTDASPKNIVLDLVDATTVPQPVPTAPGP